MFHIQFVCAIYHNIDYSRYHPPELSDNLSTYNRTADSILRAPGGENAPKAEHRNIVAFCRYMENLIFYHIICKCF